MAESFPYGRYINRSKERGVFARMFFGPDESSVLDLKKFADEFSLRYANESDAELRRVLLKVNSWHEPLHPEQDYYREAVRAEAAKRGISDEFPVLIEEIP